MTGPRVVAMNIGSEQTTAITQRKALSSCGSKPRLASQRGGCCPTNTAAMNTTAISAAFNAICPAHRRVNFVARLVCR